MAVPNEYATVQSVVGPKLKLMGDEEETRTNSFWAVNAGCIEVRKKDRNWGLLIKRGGANVSERAADIWLYKFGNGTAQVVDIVSNAEGFGGEAPSTSWQEKDIRNESEWTEPYNDAAPSPGPTPEADSVLVPTMAVIEDLYAQQDAMGATIAELRTRIEALEHAQTSFPTRIALRAWTGRYLVSEGADQNFNVMADRESAGAWETFDIEPK